MTLDPLLVSAAVLLLVGVSATGLALSGPPKKSPWAALKGWLIEPPLPDMVTDLPKSERKRLSQRAAYIYQQISITAQCYAQAAVLGGGHTAPGTAQ
jgi:hypothetical protein